MTLAAHLAIARLDLAATRAKVDPAKLAAWPILQRFFVGDLDGIAKSLGSISDALLLRDTARLEFAEVRTFTGADFHLRRALRLQSYIASHWNIYDAIGSIVLQLGRSHEAVSDRSVSGGAFIDAAVKNKDNGGKLIGRLAPTFVQMFGFPVAASYELRNRIIHTPASSEILFLDQLPGGSLRLAANATSLLGNEVEKKYGLDKADARDGGWDWGLTDLLELCEKCHEEVDEAYGLAARWSIACLKAQVEIFKVGA